MITKVKRQEYTYESLTINANGQAVQSDCSCIIFINYGTATLIINDIILLPAPVAGILSTITLPGNDGEIDRSKYRVKFSAAGTRLAVLIRKVYK